MLHTFSISYGGIVDLTVIVISWLSSLEISVIADSENFVSTEFVSTLFGVFWHVKEEQKKQST